jgi:membrane protease YdiL (CAAX protease family)
MALAGVVWVGVREHEVPVRLFVGPEWWLDLVAGAAAGIALHGSWRVLEHFSHTARGLGEELKLRLGPIDKSEVMALALLSGFAEEFLFRGAVQGSWGFWIATLLFAGLHIGPGPTLRLWGAFALVAGASFGGLMVWRGNLMAPVMAHVVVNALGLWHIAKQQEADSS